MVHGNVWNVHPAILLRQDCRRASRWVLLKASSIFPRGEDKAALRAITESGRSEGIWHSEIVVDVIQERRSNFEKRVRRRTVWGKWVSGKVGKRVRKGSVRVRVDEEFDMAGLDI